MNLNYLAVFHAVAEEGSVTRGAERLMVSQPAVSKQLGLLEKELGVKLFERVAKGVRATREGEVLKEYSRRIFGLVEEGRGALEDLQSLRRGRLRIGVSPTVGAYVLPKLLVRFGRKFPGIEVRVEVENTEVLAERLAAGVLDFGLTEGEVKGEGLAGRVFLEEELVVIVARGHVLARRKGVGMEELREQVLVAREAGEGKEPLVQRVLGVGKRGVMVLGSTEAVKEGVAEGLGIAVVPAMTVRGEGRVAVVKVREKLPRRRFYYVRLAGRRLSKAETAFACLLKHIGRGGLPAFGGRKRL
ncbi:MAG TPA: LysR family transcriptional regulator [Tepidisphaeraceae bacterium]|jgi:DNA-binding transcriptional LysR family regulator|nr:LysR family transcriptional regulator [Tepidisphaeraceae bacterium]